MTVPITRTITQQGVCPKCFSSRGCEVNNATGCFSCWFSADCKTKSECIKEIMDGYVYEVTP